MLHSTLTLTTLIPAPFPLNGLPTVWNARQQLRWRLWLPRWRLWLPTLPLLSPCLPCPVLPSPKLTLPLQSRDSNTCGRSSGWTGRQSIVRPESESQACSFSLMGTGTESGSRSLGVSLADCDRQCLGGDGGVGSSAPVASSA